MKSNEELHAKLIAAAQKNAPGDGVPYMFEKRIMARLAGRQPLSAWALLGQPMWRAAISCVAITVLCGIWSVAFRSSDTSDFSQDFERAVFAPVSQHVEDAW